MTTVAPSLKPPVSEIIAQFNAAAWMDAKIHRPSRLQQAAGKLFWTQGAVQELFCCDVADVMAIANTSTNTTSTENKDEGPSSLPSSIVRKVIASEDRTGKLSLEEELERERTRSRSVGVESYTVNLDGSTILYRANGKWNYYDVASGTSCLILKDFAGKGFPTNFTNHGFDKFSFTCENNLFMGSMLFDKATRELDVKIAQVTTIGDESKDVSCGAADYIIAEEFSRLTGHWVKGDTVLYTVSLTSHLNHISIPREEEVEVMAYPRVGDANPIVIIALYSTKERAYRVLPKAAIDAACEASNGFVPEYFPRFGFLDANTFYVLALDRAQERSSLLAFRCEDLVLCPSEGEMRRIWEEPMLAGTSVGFTVLHTQSIPWAWVEVTDALKLSSGRSVMGFHAVDSQPEKPYFHLHVAEETLPTRELAADPPAPAPLWRPLTKGDYNVNPSGISIVGDHCFFMGGVADYLGSSVAVADVRVAVAAGEAPAVTALTRPDEHVYSYTVLTAKRPKRGGGDGTGCGCGGEESVPVGIAYVSATSSSAAQLRCITFDSADDLSAASAPSVVPTGWGLALSGARNWTADSPVAYDVIAPKLYRPQSRRGVALPTLVHLPANRHRAGPSGKVPVYVYVYGGPHVQLVRAGDEYEYAFARYFQTLLYHGYAVVVVDNQMCHANHLKEHSVCKRRMGQFEVDDFVDALDGLAKEAALADVLDLDRVAINGASYGGYSSLLAMCQAPHRFRLAFAEAPVGDWRLYDTGYTERYMGLLPADEEAYTAGAVPTYVSGFPDEPLRLFISHGLTDENVHFTNTTRVVSALEAAGKPFYMDVYPGERHGLRQKPTSVPHRRAQVISTMNALL